jgi:hypothetical protein
VRGRGGGGGSWGFTYPFFADGDGDGAGAEPGEEEVDEDGVEEGHDRPRDRRRAPAHRGGLRRRRGVGFRAWALAGSGRKGRGGEDGRLKWRRGCSRSEWKEKKLRKSELTWREGERENLDGPGFVRLGLF